MPLVVDQIKERSMSQVTIPHHSATLEQIARQHLGLETLETRRSDQLDFHDLAVWSIEAALQAAFEAGKRAAG